MSPRTIEASAPFELESFDSLKWEVEYEFQVFEEYDGRHRQFERFKRIVLVIGKMGILLTTEPSSFDRSQLRALCEDHMMEVEV